MKEEILTVSALAGLRGFMKWTLDWVHEPNDQNKAGYNLKEKQYERLQMKLLWDLLRYL